MTLKTACPKCGCIDLYTRWKPAEERYGYKECRNPDEHLCRNCRGCGYQWDEMTLDTRSQP
jgi:hypothetical protein